MFKFFDEEKFKEKLVDTNPDEVLKCKDVNEAAELLVNKLNKVLDEMAPVKTVQTRKKYAAWLSEETKKFQADRDAAQEKAAQTSPSPDNSSSFHSD